MNWKAFNVPLPPPRVMIVITCWISVSCRTLSPAGESFQCEGFPPRPSAQPSLLLLQHPSRTGATSLLGTSHFWLVNSPLRPISYRHCGEELWEPTTDLWLSHLKEGTACNSFWPLSLSYALRGWRQQNIWVSHTPKLTEALFIICILRSVLIIIRYAFKYFKGVIFFSSSICSFQREVCD